MMKKMKHRTFSGVLLWVRNHAFLLCLLKIESKYRDATEIDHSGVCDLFNSHLHGRISAPLMCLLLLLSYDMPWNISHTNRNKCTRLASVGTPILRYKYLLTKEFIPPWWAFCFFLIVLNIFAFLCVYM